nr:uncharacterized protein LOC109174707 [Ipomoea batatas]
MGKSKKRPPKTHNERIMKFPKGQSLNRMPHEEEACCGVEAKGKDKVPLEEDYGAKDSPKPKPSSSSNSVGVASSVPRLLGSAFSLHIPYVAEMEEIVAGMEQVVAEEVKVKWQFEDISVETQELMNSQPSQAVQNQAPPLSEFIYAQLPTESSTPNVITRSGKNYVTVATLQQSKAVQRETRKKRTTTKRSKTEGVV